MRGNYYVTPIVPKKITFVGNVGASMILFGENINDLDIVSEDTIHKKDNKDQRIKMNQFLSFIHRKAGGSGHSNVRMLNFSTPSKALRIKGL